MMELQNYTFWEIHYLWWFVGAIALLWVFVPPFDVLKLFVRKETLLELLKNRLALGQIDKEGFQKKKKLIDL